MLPGGGVEGRETLLDTLVREVKEETNRDVSIETVKPLFYQYAHRKNESGEWEFLQTEVRFTVVVENDIEFVSDPDNGNTIETKWVSVDNLDKYLDWREAIVKIKEQFKRFTIVK